MAFLPPITASPHPPRRTHHNPLKSPIRPRADLNRALENLSRLDRRSTRPNPPADTGTGTGTVHIIGAGPGDASLLTLRAVQILQRADVVLHDRLVGADVLSFARDDAQLVCVPKGRGTGTGSQPLIERQMVRYAARGLRVVRLKGGDATVFGRLADELHALHEQLPHVRPVVVPGITTASGVAAALGFPLTQTRVADAVRFVTGHLGERGEFEVGRVTPATTLVIYMGLLQISKLMQLLIEDGLDADTAAVAVQAGTTAEQRVVWGRVRSLGRDVQRVGLESPTIIFVGDVVATARGWQSYASSLLET